MKSTLILGIAIAVLAGACTHHSDTPAAPPVKKSTEGASGDQVAKITPPTGDRYCSVPQVKDYEKLKAKMDKDGTDLAERRGQGWTAQDAALNEPRLAKMCSDYKKYPADSKQSCIKVNEDGSAKGMILFDPQVLANCKLLFED